MKTTSRYQRSVDPDNETVCIALFALIDRVDRRELEDLPTLYEVLDPDKLNGLFAGRQSQNVECIVSFRYAGYEVYVDAVPGQPTMITLITEDISHVDDTYDGLAPVRPDAMWP